MNNQDLRGRIDEELEKVTDCVFELDNITRALNTVGNLVLADSLETLSYELSLVPNRVRVLQHQITMVDLNEVNSQLGAALSKMVFPLEK